MSLFVNTLGTLGGDPVLRQPEKGQRGNPFATFSLAVDTGYGENKQTLWLDCCVYGPRAKAILDWVHKGDQLVVHGNLTVESYDKKDGSGKAIAYHIKQVLEFNFVRGSQGQRPAQAAPGRIGGGQTRPPFAQSASGPGGAPRQATGNRIQHPRDARTATMDEDEIPF